MGLESGDDGNYPLIVCLLQGFSEAIFGISNPSPRNFSVLITTQLQYIYS